MTLNDVHGIKTIIVENGWPDDKPPTADGMVTNKPGIVLGAVSADCPVVLFADDKSRVIGTAHAGWRGAKQGILKSVVNTMLALNADLKNISAIIGPCIAQCSYEVNYNFYQDFMIESQTNQSYFKPANKGEHYLFDLQSYINDKLHLLGIKHIDSIPADTYQDEDRFFSFRRSSHQNEKNYGCHLSCIFLE